ncbi:sigma-70 family RNA polymerase sigma factor [Niabella sp.]|uniref:sigma-70 family RNA polymerase sigma factor n=1 Tax=Niabella sp. TaxID=1962976 RepID=UPI00262DA60E|nr:sigma-70 family RNA polymerase sigma factor [Niabella sp.]
MHTEEINALIEGLKKDDAQAFDQLFRLFYRRLLKFALQFLTVQQDAEDVVSIFFVRLWQKRKNLPVIHYPETYFYTAVRNTCLNYKRAHKLRMITDSNDPGTDHHPAESKELQRLLEKAVQALPLQRKLIFMLVKEDGLKCREVAVILNLSVRTVESQLYKAVKTLAGEISGHLGYDPQKAKMARSLGMLLLLM